MLYELGVWYGIHLTKNSVEMVFLYRCFLLLNLIVVSGSFPILLNPILVFLYSIYVLHVLTAFGLTILFFMIFEHLLGQVLIDRWWCLHLQISTIARLLDHINTCLFEGARIHFYVPGEVVL